MIKLRVHDALDQGIRHEDSEKRPHDCSWKEQTPEGRLVAHIPHAAAKEPPCPD